MRKAILVLTFMLIAKSALAADLGVTDPWVRLMPPVAQTSAAYMTLHNPTASDIAVVGVTSDAAAKADLHGMRMQDGKMVMYHLDSVVVPAHGEFSFAPGGAHIMLIGLKQPLRSGQEVNIVLHLTDGENIPMLAPVRDMRGKRMHMR